MTVSPVTLRCRVERDGWRGLLAGVIAGLLLALVAVDDVRAQERNRARDFDFTLEAMDRGRFFGSFWTDGTTTWTLEGSLESLVAYDMTTGRRDPARSIPASLLQDLGNLGDLWSDGTTMWILGDGGDLGDYKLFAFSMATGERDGAKDVVEFQDRFWPGSIWSDGATLWVSGRHAVLAYDWATGRREPAKEFRWDDYFAVHDIWSDGATMWMAGTPDRYEPQQPKVRAYDLATGQREPAKEIDTGDVVPAALGSDGRTMWIRDREDNLYAYRLSTGNREPAKDVSLLSRPVLEPNGLWSNGRKAWVLTDEVWVYDLATGHRDLVIRPERVLGRRQLVSYPTDIWSDGTTMWIAYRQVRLPEERRLYAYDLPTGRRDPVKDVELDRLDPGPKFDLIRKIWFDGRTLWVVNAGALEQGEVTYAYAYDWPSGRRVPAKDLELDNSNRRPEDVWTDGTTMWVLDGRDGMVAYDLSTGNLDPGRSFDLPDAGRSIWSDGTTMWVAFYHDDTTVYAYDLATGNRNPARDHPSLLGPLWPSGAAGSSSDGTTLWVMDDAVYALELARNREPAKDRFFLKDRFILGAVRGRDGLWSSDGRTLWALDDGRLRAYDLDSDQGPRPRTLLPRETRRIALPGEGGDLWSDGATMWIPAGGGNVALGERTAPKLYGHDLAADAWDGFGPPPGPDREFALDPANANPSGLWSDGETMWVADAADGKLYAYDWPTGGRVPDRDFDTLKAAGNTEPRAIWSDGTTMWVSGGGKLYAYHMPRGGRVFTDPLLEAGVTAFRTVHVTELRDRIDNLRIANGLSAFSWTDPVILSGVTPIRAVHLTELRTALDQAYATAGRIRPRYAEAIRAGGVIKAAHVTELRRLVVALE